MILWPFAYICYRIAMSSCHFYQKSMGFQWIFSGAGGWTSTPLTKSMRGLGPCHMYDHWDIGDWVLQFYRHVCVYIYYNIYHIYIYRYTMYIYIYIYLSIYRHSIHVMFAYIYSRIYNILCACIFIRGYHGDLMEIQANNWCLGAVEHGLLYHPLVVI